MNKQKIFNRVNRKKFVIWAKKEEFWTKDLILLQKSADQWLEQVDHSQVYTLLSREEISPISTLVQELLAQTQSILIPSSENFKILFTDSKKFWQLRKNFWDRLKLSFLEKSIKRTHLRKFWGNVWTMSRTKSRRREVKEKCIIIKRCRESEAATVAKSKELTRTRISPGLRKKKFLKFFWVRKEFWHFCMIKPSHLDLNHRRLEMVEPEVFLEQALNL